MIEIILIGVGLFFIILWKLIEQVSHKSVYGLTTYEADKLFIKLEPNIKKLLRKNWEILELKSGSISKYNKFYTIYVSVVNGKINKWTNDNLKFNSKGEIIQQDLVRNMEDFE